MGTILGLLIIALGSLGQSSSYVPIKKVKNWSWENFWLVQGIFAWLVFPLLGALLGVPSDSSLFQLWGSGGALSTILFGILWGVGGLTFGLSMRYLGVALGQSIALGTCAAFGTLFPALIAGKDIFRGEGLILLIGVCITLAGIAVIGYAGSLRSKNMTDAQRKEAVKDFALTKGLLVALLAGVMSACFALGLDSGVLIKEAALAGGVQPIFAGLPVIFLVTLGGFFTNAVYCIQQNIKNKTGKAYLSVPKNVLLNNISFCALAGILWYSQFFGLEMGKSFLADSPVLLAFSWSILMSLNVIFSNVWGIILKEWKGVSQSTIGVLALGLLILISSIIVVAMSQSSSQEEISEENYLKVDKKIWDQYEEESEKISAYFALHPEKKDSLLKERERIQAITYRKNEEAAIKYASVPSGLQRLFIVRLELSKDTLSAIIAKLPQQMKESVYGKRIQSHINTNQIEKGSLYDDLEMVDKNGNKFILSSLSGKNILLLYGGLGCMGEEGREFLVNLYSKTDRNSFEIVVYWPCSSIEKLQEIANQYPNLNFITVSDFLQDGSPLKIKYGAQSTPTCFLINKEGVVSIKSVRLPMDELGLLFDNNGL